QRNADALMLLVSKADLPKHGGLPAAVTLTMTMEQAEQVANTSPGQSHTESHTECGDTGVPHFAGGPPDAESGAGADSWSAGGAGLGQLGHDQVLGQGGARFGLCSCQITPVIAEPREPIDPRSLLNRFGLTQLQPVAVGRSVRLATPAQRRALAVRDGGCVIPGCDVGPEHTQPHHVTAWSLGGATDLDSLASVCWPPHRPLDLGRWEQTRDTDPGQPGADQPEVGEPSAGDPSQPWWTITPTPRHRWRRPPPS
ncbi:MAG: HNH endonuclease signature motif containing protein, partial [Candidatus Nanopelagicales bacterium]|nr:HNH endonuclease signature motif containing protein [Candidatus Nanopelagicales bacterium]